MKFPSLFRTPRYQKFHIEPRYYDPIKEEMEERTRQIKRGMQSDTHSEWAGTTSRISGAFTRSKSRSSGSASFMQLVIMLLLSFLIFGYIYVGNLALYIFALAATTLFYLKYKRII